MKKTSFYILFFFVAFGFSQQNPVSIQTDTTSIRIGEQIQLKISVDAKGEIMFPKLVLDSLGRMEVVEVLEADTLKNRYEKKYLLTSFDSGQYVIPQQSVLINNRSYLTDSLLINVATVKVDTTKQKMFPIKSVKREPKVFDDYKHWLWWIVPILVLIIGIILYFLFRKKKEKVVKKVYVAPIAEAMQRLKELDEKQLLKENKVKVYYSELTDIVRTYIEKDINIPALESTTDELMETINDFNTSSNLGISRETMEQLKEVLQNADLVKFAKSKPVIESIKMHRGLSEKVLKELKPEEGETLNKEENEL